MTTPGKASLTSAAYSRAAISANNSMVMDNSFDDLNDPDDDAWEDSSSDEDDTTALAEIQNPFEDHIVLDDHIAFR